MTEREWVKKILKPEIQKAAEACDENLAVEVGQRLPYTYQVRSYAAQEPKGSQRAKATKRTCWSTRERLKNGPLG